MGMIKINLLDGGVMGVSVRKCTPEQHEAAGGDCNQCLDKKYTDTDCEVAYFGRTRHGDNALKLAQDYVREHNPNGALARSNA